MSKAIITYEGKPYEVVEWRYPKIGEWFLSQDGYRPKQSPSGDETYAPILRPLEQAPEAEENPECETCRHSREVCLAENPQTPNLNCCREKGHAGPHRACGLEHNTSEWENAPQPLQLRVGYRYESEKGGVVEITRGPDEEGDYSAGRYFWKANGERRFRESDTAKKYGNLIREIGPAAPEQPTPTPEPRETLWDKYAMAALTGMLADPEGKATMAEFSRLACEVADAMMKERAERQKRGVK